MNCIEYQELISGYLDDGLSKKELKVLLFHLEGCQCCKKNLTDLILQKEKLLSLQAIPSGPIPDLNFAQRIIEKITQEDHDPTTKKYSFNLSQFINWLFFPIKNPFYAVVFSFLILIGVLTGVFLENFHTHHEPKKLLSVYELQVKKPLQGAAQLASLEDEKKAIVFHHVASSSIETLANEPCLLKYTAYTASTDHQ
ncbi:MAG: zf-HC2 domain-containing protein [Thermodesulfobacteriota bacterium]|jgi:hypothetical protein|nr:MAG: zf-HC2 domain-containing protein [Thermodesulfobacteriota bacterium]